LKLLKSNIKGSAQAGEVLELESHLEKMQLTKKIQALYDFLGKIMGKEIMDQSIKSMNLKSKAESSSMEERVTVLRKLVFKDQEMQPAEPQMITNVLEEIEEGIADILARKTVEHRLQHMVAERLEKRQRQYMDEIKLEIVSKKSGPENANTLKKYAMLEKLESKKLARSAMECMRPNRIDEIVGQDRAIKALITKVASPFPQHVLIYGPPGVGKTTAARLVLEMAKAMPYTPFEKEAPFVEVDGTTLRWDPREITNPLLGSVHDPIYQGTKRELAETGIPEPKPGLVTEAHGGVLFIDEIGELDLFLQNKLLKVLEDKRVSFDSSYYDPDDPAVPKYVKKLFDEGAPADFILIGATTRHPSEINPASISEG
jgi:ATP-dependent Lon protease